MKKLDKFALESNLFINLFDAMPFNVYAADIDSYDLIFINKQLKSNIAEYQNKKCYQAIYQRDSPCSGCTIKKLLNSKAEPNGEVLVSEFFNDVDDEWYQLQDKCISWPDGRIAKYTIAVNITAQKRIQNDLAEAHAELALKNRQLEKLSITDPLTQLFNRLKMDMLLEEELSRAERYNRDCSVIIMDLDNFKLVNDNYGHLTGDNVLVSAAAVIRSQIRSHDHACRWGGEEFFILCPETNIEEACNVAEKLRQELAVLNNKIAGQVTGSFGVACFDKLEGSQQLLARADQALYNAKENGRNQVVSLIK